MLIDLPKDVSLGMGPYIPPEHIVHKTYQPKTRADRHLIKEAVTMMADASGRSLLRRRRYQPGRARRNC